MQTRESCVTKRIDALASPKLFFWSSILIAIHFYLAAPYCMKHMRDGMVDGINNNLLLDWIVEQSSGYFAVQVWMAIAFVLFFVIAVNIVSRIVVEFRSLRSTAKTTSEGNAGRAPARQARKICIFMIHVSFFGMLAFYFVSSMTGYKFVGPIVKKGQVISHPMLPSDLQCLSVRKASAKMAKPEVVFKVVSDGETFTAPGWFRGTFYDVRGGIEKSPSVTPGKRGRNMFVLKLFAHRFHVLGFASLLAVWTTGFCLFMFVRFRRKKDDVTGAQVRAKSVSTCSS